MTRFSWISIVGNPIMYGIMEKLWTFNTHFDAFVENIKSLHVLTVINGYHS